MDDEDSPFTKSYATPEHKSSVFDSLYDWATTPIEPGTRNPLMPWGRDERGREVTALPSIFGGGLIDVGTRINRVMEDARPSEWNPSGGINPMVGAGIAMDMTPGVVADGVSRNLARAAGDGVNALIGLMGVQNLTESLKGASRRGAPHPDWGSEASLAKAKEAVANGMSHDDAFKQFGWSKNAYGRETPEWYTALDDTQLKLKPEALHETDKPNITQTIHRLQSGDVIDHPELFDAYPSLSRIPVAPGAIKTDRNLGRGSDTTTVNASIGIHEANRPITSLSAHAANIPQLESLITHEVAGHGAAAKSGLPFGTFMRDGPKDKFSFNSPEASDAMTRFKRDAGGRDVGELHPSGMPKDWSYGKHTDLNSRYDDIYRHGNLERYFNDHGEVIARGEQELRDMMLRNPKIGIDTPRQFSHIEPYDLRHHYPQDGFAWDMRPYKVIPPFEKD